MIKGIKALENIKKERPQYFSTLYDLDMWKEDIETIEKELKVLEIIKNKNVNILEIKLCNNYEEYNCCASNFFDVEELTQEEFDLLKEVLENE